MAPWTVECQHHAATDSQPFHLGTTYSYIWRNGVKISLDAIVAQALYNLRQEQLNTLERHAQADLYEQKAISRGAAEDFERVTQAELLVHDR